MNARSWRTLRQAQGDNGAAGDIGSVVTLGGWRLCAVAQLRSPRVRDGDGAAVASAETVAITGGTVYPVSGPRIPNGTVVIRDGRIVAVGANVAIPAGARRIDARGKIVTPGLINAQTQLGLVEVGGERTTRNISARGIINADFRPWEGFFSQSASIASTREDGITTVGIMPAGCVRRGPGGGDGSRRRDGRRDGAARAGRRGRDDRRRAGAPPTTSTSRPPATPRPAARRRRRRSRAPTRSPRCAICSRTRASTPCTAKVSTPVRCAGSLRHTARLKRCSTSSKAASRCSWPWTGSMTSTRWCASRNASTFGS